MLLFYAIKSLQVEVFYLSFVFVVKFKVYFMFKENAGLVNHMYQIFSSDHEKDFIYMFVLIYLFHTKYAVKTIGIIYYNILQSTSSTVFSILMKIKHLECINIHVLTCSREVYISYLFSSQALV